jgi:uncharacterized protein YcfJ
MTRTALVLGLGAAMAIPTLAAPISAQARTACEQRAHDRRVGGTVLGAVAGGLLGNALSHGGGRTGGAILGAGAGAVVGNQLSRTSCDHPHAYSRTHDYRDTRTHGDYAANDYRYGSTARCHYETRSYYDSRGKLVYAPTQVCD